ncbi:MAG: type III pantothenate kinase, partial [Natronospirillum sp.]
SADSKVVWHRAQSFPLSVLTSEYDTTALGCDRWVGMLGVLSELGREQSVLLVDAGTAVNIELLDGNHHCGGWIMPGYRAWFDSLLSNTQMRMDRPEQPMLQYGKRTADAVANAWLESVVGIVERHRNRIPNLVIVVTGGDASRLASALENVMWIPDLMFKGLGFWFEQVESDTACGG